jgi:hypothetical protein
VRDAERVRSIKEVGTSGWEITVEPSNNIDSRFLHCTRTAGRR